MPKNKKTNKSNEENRIAWRTPVKLPTAVSGEPIKSLYNQNNVVESDAKFKAVTPETVIDTDIADPEIENQTTETLNLISQPTVNESEIEISETDKQAKKEAALKSESETVPIEKTAMRRSEADFLKLLKTDKMDFYSLAEILRGSSMALYCVLYSESLAKNENRCQIRQTELMMRAGINNPATLYKQERWLTALGLISKSVRLGNHHGASYEVEPLEILPLPQFIIEQFDGYLAEYLR